MAAATAAATTPVWAMTEPAAFVGLVGGALSVLEGAGTSGEPVVGGRTTVPGVLVLPDEGQTVTVEFWMYDLVLVL